MHLDRIVLRGFRNLHDLDLELPPAGAVLIGNNAQGKTNLLEAVGYPVLFRALRGAGDADVARFDGPGFRVDAAFHDGARRRTVEVLYTAHDRRKRIGLDGAPVERLADAIGTWVAVAFLPRDVALAAGPAAERRHYLDRMLSLASPGYLRALVRYKGAVARRNAALRQGQPAVAWAFDEPLAAAGVEVVRARLAWVAEAARRFPEEFAALGEARPASLAYRGHAELAEPEGWAAALDRARPRDAARGLTSVGPHRDDLTIVLDGRPIREYGSTGQVRSAAVALKLVELATISELRGVAPALLLDDVFAELDQGRQARLAERLLSRRRGQVFVSAPREDELPAGLGLPVWTVDGGAVRPAA